MTYKELYESAADKLEKSKITLGEFEKMIEPLNAEIDTDSDTISRQVAISAICSACGKIDCDKMDKCEKLQLPPANTSEIPNSSDTISRQAAIDKIVETADEIYKIKQKGATYPHDDFFQGMAYAENIVKQLPPAQPDTYWKEQCQSYEQTINKLREALSTHPEIIRCKDCKCWVPGYITDNDDFIPPKCREWQQMVGHSSDDYCSLAERREVTT